MHNVCIISFVLFWPDNRSNYNNLQVLQCTGYITHQEVNEQDNHSWRCMKVRQERQRTRRRRMALPTQRMSLVGGAQNDSSEGVKFCKHRLMRVDPRVDLCCKRRSSVARYTWRLLAGFPLAWSTSRTWRRRCCSPTSRREAGWGGPVKVGSSVTSRDLACRLRLKLSCILQALCVCHAGEENRSESFCCV